MIRRLLPQPLLAAFVFLLWLLLNNAASLATVALGALLALAVPPLTRRFWPDPPDLRRPGLALALFVRVLGDILRANLHVARLVVGPIARLRPGFVEVPLDIRDPFVATVLGSIVSLTPGTVSIDFDPGRRVLHVHALDVADPAALAAQIKRRYEAPLKEIFRC